MFGDGVHRSGLVAGVVALVAFGPGAGDAVAQGDLQAMNGPMDPLRIVGNVYYVGASDLAAYLITTPEGHILLDGGLAETAPLIRRSVARLGFRMEDVRILLNSHAHLDHAGGLADLAQSSGATVVVSEADADLVERGGRGDPLLADSARFPPVNVDRRIRDGETVSLGGVLLTAHVTAGHTRGCTTWTMDAREGERTYHVVFVCSVTILPGVRLTERPTWPGIAADFERTFAVLESLPVDVFLASHGSFFGLAAKAEAVRAGVRPNPFVDPERYRRYLARGRSVLEQRMAAERAGAS